MKRRIIGIIAAIALATVGTFALVSYVQSAKDKAVAGERRTAVYVLSKDVPANTPLDEIERSLEIVEVPDDVRVEGAVSDLDLLDGDLVAAVDLQSGEQLLASRLVAGSEVAMTDVPAGLQEVTVALDPERAVGGDLAVGDTVGVVLSFDPFDTDVVRFDPANPFPVAAPEAAPAPTDAPAADEEDSEDSSAKTPNMTHLTFHKVLVTRVQFDKSDRDDTDTTGSEADTTQTDNPIDEAPSARVHVTLALSSPEVEQFVFAAEFGHIWLTAENADADENGTRIVDLGEVYATTEVQP